MAYEAGDVIGTGRAAQGGRQRRLAPACPQEAPRPRVHPLGSARGQDEPMGVNNRQRRAARRRQKARRESPGVRQPGVGATQAERHDSAPDDLIAFAVAHLWPERHPGALAGVEILAEAASVPRARREIAWRLSGWMTRALRSAWDRGWQPADLPRLAAREFSESHRAICRDAIAMEARFYLAGGVEPDGDWRVQLEELGALTWAVPDELLLDEWAASEPLTDVLLRVLELLSLLARIPDQPILIPPPGQWSRAGRRGGGAPAGAATANDSRVLARVRALLVKAESTEFPDEAEALSAKAQELISRHAIDRAALAGGDHPVTVAGRRIAVDNPYPQAKSVLLGTVAAANRCQAVRSVAFGFSTLFGTADDLASVELLYTSLLSQATAAMLAAGSTDRRRRLPSFRESFLAAYAVRVGERLRDTADAAVGEGVARHGDRLLPVLARRSDAVDAAVAAAFPQTSLTPLRASNHVGWAAGLAAAELARLGPDHVLDPSAPPDDEAPEAGAGQLHLAV
jgi:hypothetical protein